MLRKKSIVAAAVASAAIIALSASPAFALRYLADPNYGGGVPGCSNRVLLQSWKIDNPRKSGFQQWGTAKVYRATCYSSTTGAGWSGAWTEARLDFAGDALKTSISVESNGTLYTLSDWDARGAGVWHDSPVLERPSGAFTLASVATSAHGDLDLYNA